MIKILKSWNYSKFIFPVILGIFFFFLAYYLHQPYHTFKDWDDCFRPGTLYLIAGRNPHTIQNCNFMTWALFPLVPIALLPPIIGRALLSSIAIVSYFLVARKMGASLLVAIVMVLNPLYFIHNIIDPNVDWLIAIGYILPPQIGLFFCLIKPQLSIGLILFWLVEAYMSGGIKRVLHIFSPAVGLFGLTLIIYGPYFLTFSELLHNPGWNLSFWPYSIVIGIVMLILSFKKHNSGNAIISGPFFSPYMGYYSWPIAVLGLLPHRKIIAVSITILTFIILVLAVNVLPLQ